MLIKTKQAIQNDCVVNVYVRLGVSSLNLIKIYKTNSQIILEHHVKIIIHTFSLKTGFQVFDILLPLWQNCPFSLF